MSKKDYQAIAAAIYATRQDHPAFSQHFDSSNESASDHLIDRLAYEFKRDNPNFDRARFIEACETGTCKGMPKPKTPKPNPAYAYDLASGIDSITGEKPYRGRR